MAFEFDKTNRSFNVIYQAPFGELDTTSFPSMIQEKNFAATDGFYTDENILKPINYKSFANNFNISGESVMGFIPYSAYTSVGGTQFQIGYLITNTNIYMVKLDNNNVLSFPKIASYTPTLLTINNFSYLIIDKVAAAGDQPMIYWTTGTWKEIWSFNPKTGVAALLTNYVGGGTLGLIDNQMVNLGGNSAADGYVPNRVSWSAPGQYDQWQPYSIATGLGNYAAGFNDIPGTNDLITGFAAIGTVGYIFRQQGITQMSPTGSGIQPFNFNHLWASELGIGAVYPQSIAQYGSIVAFISDNNIYSLGLSGLQELGQSARNAIFKAINLSAQIVSAQIIPYVLDNPDSNYIVGVSFQIPGSVNNLKNNFFAISLTSNRVLQFGNLLTGSSPASPIQLSYFQPLKVFVAPGNYQQTRQTKSLAVWVHDLMANFSYLDFDNTKVATVTFRMEQMKFGWQPTINKVGFIASLVDSTTPGSISVSVDGGATFNTAFPDIHFTAGAANGVMQTIFTDGVQTLERPQLTVKLTNVQIALAYYKGILAEYEII